MDRVIAIIPARGGSRAVPRKNIKPLGGRPLIAWTIDAAKNAKCVDRVFVTTEDKEIRQIAEDHLAEVIDRPMCLATDDVQSAELFLYTLRQLRTEWKLDPEVLIYLPPTNPFRNSRDIDEAFHLYNGHGCVIGVKRDMKFHWAWDGEHEEFVPLQTPPEHRRSRQETAEWDWFCEENGGLYVIGANDLAMEKHYWVPPYQLYIMSEESSIQIDTPYDWFLAEACLEYMERNKSINTNPVPSKILGD